MYSKLIKLFISILCVIYLSVVDTQAAQTTGFPKIFNLWGGNNKTAADFAKYAMWAMYSDGMSASDQGLADQIHTINPNSIILLTANVVSDCNDPGCLDWQSQWYTAQKGTPNYSCIYRDLSGNILLESIYSAAFYNLGNSYCRTYLLNYFIRKWNATGGHFDGYFIDMMGNQAITTILGTTVIDANGDGLADNPSQINADYKAGMKSFLANLRFALPNIIITCNDSPTFYGQWINGRLFELDLRRYLDNPIRYSPWDYYNSTYYQPWLKNSNNLPNTTVIMNSENGILLRSKYNPQSIWSIKAPILAEYSADYRRMRFGLVTALMNGAYYSYDFGSYRYGLNWWYDEYEQNGQMDYLGQPVRSMQQLYIPGIRQRKFENGLVLLNMSSSEQIVPLQGTYKKLTGNQSPLYYYRMDDNEARVNGSWVTRIANSDEWGTTIKTIFGPVIESSVTYSIPVTYAGMYNVLVWNNPNGTYSKNVPVSINGIVTILNEAVGVLGWQNIGQYNLTKGTTTISILGTGTGLIVADAVKIESVDRYNDGSLVSSVVLQPNDAIILLTTNSGTITPTATPTQTFIPNKPSKPTFLPTSALTR